MNQGTAGAVSKQPLYTWVYSFLVLFTDQVLCPAGPQASNRIFRNPPHLRNYLLDLDRIWMLFQQNLPQSAPFAELFVGFGPDLNAFPTESSANRSICGTFCWIWVLTDLLLQEVFQERSVINQDNELSKRH